jgi:hypothetical protein
MWDYKGIAEELKAAGFVDISRAVFGDSADPPASKKWKVMADGRTALALSAAGRRNVSRATGISHHS